MSVSPNTLALSDAEFEKTVLKDGGVTLVDFSAEWCGPCKALAPIVDELANEFAGKAKVAKIDVDANPETSAKYGVRGIPTVLIFRNGELVERLVGLQAKEKYTKALGQHL